VTDHDALLAAVIANPDEDTPRLVMADWFDEHGQNDRAEFIRVQCELARWEEPNPFEHDAGGCEVIRGRRDELRRRERELLGAACDGKRDWALPWVGEQREWRFVRGFVDSTTCTAEDWLADGDAVRAAQPVREVTFVAPPGEFAELTVGPFDGSYSYRIAGRTVRRHADEPEGATFLFARRWPGVWFGTYHVGLHVVRYYRVADVYESIIPYYRVLCDAEARSWERRDVTREGIVSGRTGGIETGVLS
jgi:uncharacterized protein (TIGR02996 family)